MMADGTMTADIDERFVAANAIIATLTQQRDQALSVIASQAADVAVLNARLASSNARIADLSKRIATLDSGNSEIAAALDAAIAD